MGVVSLNIVLNTANSNAAAGLVRPAIFPILCVLLLGFSTVYAEDRWVTDDFEIMLRSGKSSKQRIVKQLTTGTKVELIKVDEESGFTEVKVASGETGWVLTRYLQAIPTAGLRLPPVEQQLKRSKSEQAVLRKEISTLKKEQQTLKREVADLQSSNRSSQNQLDRITKLASDPIKVDDQNQQLMEQVNENRQTITRLEAENIQLASRANREWFLVGGAVLVLGMLLGIIIPRVAQRNKSSWGEF
jgi:SH3 domain protein